MKFFREILSESAGASSMRIMALTSVFIAGGLAFYGMYKNINPVQLSALCSVFLGGGFGGKVLQKKEEKRKTGVKNET